MTSKIIKKEKPLPDKQRRHIRKYESGKIAVINPGNKALAGTSRLSQLPALSGQKPQKLSLLDMASNRVKILPKRLPQKLRINWTDVLKRDDGTNYPISTERINYDYLDGDWDMTDGDGDPSGEWMRYDKDDESIEVIRIVDSRDYGFKSPPRFLVQERIVFINELVDKKGNPKVDLKDLGSDWKKGEPILWLAMDYINSCGLDFHSGLATAKEVRAEFPELYKK